MLRNHGGGRWASFSVVSLKHTSQHSAGSLIPKCYMKPRGRSVVDRRDSLAIPSFDAMGKDLNLDRNG